MATTATLRALAFVMLNRVIRLGGISGLIIFGLGLALTWALASYVSAWWWLLLLIIVPPLLIGLVLWTLARNVARAVYATPLSRPQRTALNQFIDKVQGLAEYRSLPPWLFGFVLAKDLVLHRDARSAPQNYRQFEHVKA